MAVVIGGESSISFEVVALRWIVFSGLKCGLIFDHDDYSETFVRYAFTEKWLSMTSIMLAWRRFPWQIQND